LRIFKTVWVIYLGVIIFISGIIASYILVGLICGVIFIIAYFLTKKISISLETSEGMQLGLSFKRSIIENVTVDIEQARKVIMIINDNIIKQQERI
jgi:hypothetical protein